MVDVATPTAFDVVASDDALFEPAAHVAHLVRRTAVQRLGKRRGADERQRLVPQLRITGKVRDAQHRHAFPQFAALVPIDR